jgi:general secretion pathway protein C
MVRALAIRQVFLLVDLALAAAFFGTAGLVLWKHFQPVAEAEMTEAAPAAGAENLENLVPEVAPLAQYAKIMQSGLFGDAGRKVVAAPAPVVEEKPVEPEVTETKLNLTLIGVVATSPRDPFASAIITNNDQGAISMSYGTGEAVVDNVFLDEVHPRFVILRNESATPNRLERLSLEGEEGEPAPAVPDPRQLAGAPKPGLAPSKRITVSRQEITTDIMTNLAELQEIRPEAYLDEQGNVLGLTAENIGQIPLAKKLGLQDGDVLQDVNGEKIDSEQKIMEVMQQQMDARSIRIGILRNGKPTVLEYNLR